MEEQTIRLQKYIAMSGAASRRKAEELIKSGLVEVNGEMVTELGVKINPEKDSVSLGGRLIKPERKRHYIMLNKPAGYVTTMEDELGRKTVMELVSDIEERIYPVGRLDYDTEGLLLLTNDGNFANAVAHPKNRLDKTYIASVKGIPSAGHIKALRKGVDIGGYVTAPAQVGIAGFKNGIAEVAVTIHEGKNRQVRRMFEAVGLEIIRLKRISIGNIKLGHLPRGKWRRLRQAEIESLLKGADVHV